MMLEMVLQSAAATLKPREGTQVQVSPAYYPALDGLRAVAFCLVFLAHYYKLPWGWAGVNVFFVLSGFLITGNLLDGKDKPNRVKTFYLRRALRIFPLYYAVLLIFLLLTPWLHFQWSRLWIAWPLYLGNFLRLHAPATHDLAQLSVSFGWLRSSRFPNLVFYFGHFWSLCVEEQFYLIWPWLVFGVSVRYIKYICWVAVLGLPLCRFWVQAHAAPALLDRELLYVVGVPFQLDALLAGGLLAVYWRSQYRERLRDLMVLTFRICSVLLALYIAYCFHKYGVSPREVYRNPAGRLTWGLSLIDLYSAALLVVSLTPGSLLYRALKQSLLRRIGQMSYGAYVFHDLLHGFYIQFGTHVLRHFQLAPERYLERFVLILGACGTAILTVLSYNCLEQPFLRLKSRIR